MEGRVKGQRCGVEGCRSRLYDEGEDGFMYCENGHRSGQLVAAEDDDNFLGAQRRDKTRKRTEDEEAEPSGMLLKGREALDLYLKSLQLVVRQQVWFLVHDQGLPAELETVVFDLWTLRILHLEERLGESQGYQSQSQNFTSSASEDEDARPMSRKTSREKMLKQTPSLLDSLVLCYLGIITLRLPVTPGDIRTWVIDGEMAYWGSLKLIPTAMAQKLPSFYHASLNPNSAFSNKRFYNAISDISIGFGQEYGIVWPKLNHPLLVFRYMKELALPLEIYDATVRLAGLLKCDFTLPTTSNSRSGISEMPEARLISCLIVCTKLLYPFDGARRYPHNDAEPAATIMNWKKWNQHLANAFAERQGDPGTYTKAELMDTKEKDIFSMSNNQLDQYLDWYQHDMLDANHISHGESVNFQNALYELFPIDASHSTQPPRSVSQTPTHHEALSIVEAVHGDLRSRGPISVTEQGPNISRPGEAYVYYKNPQSMPDSAKKFYQEAARIVGLDMDMLVRAVLFTEQKLAKWKNQKLQTLPIS